MFGKQVVEKIKTHFFFLNHAIYEIMWKNTVEPEGPQMTVWRMHISRWIHRVTDLQPEYVNALLFHCNKGCTNVLQCYIMHTLPGLSYGQNLRRP